MITIRINETVTIGQINPMLHGQFIEFLGSCIYGGIWVGEDSEIPNYNGLRKDVVDALKEIKPPIIRWPGGCYADTYHWRDGIGPRNKRPIRYNENFGTYEMDDNQFGTHEFMMLCKFVGAKPWLNVNMMTGSVAEMCEWMEYCNRKEMTTLSIERGENGSEVPFNVKYWGIGNEPWAGGGTYTSETYANEYRKYSTAVPSFSSYKTEDNEEKIIKIACGPDGNKPKERVEWTEKLFESFQKFRAPEVDAIDLHFYNWNLGDFSSKETEFDINGWYTVIDSCLELDIVIKEQEKIIEEGNKYIKSQEGLLGELYGHPLKSKLVVGEWGNWHSSAFTASPALYQQCTMRDAITTALSLDIFHRNCNRVDIACVAQSINVLNSIILTDGIDFLKTPNFDVFKMYHVHQNAMAVECFSDNSYKAEEGNIFTFASVNNELIHLNIINTDYDKTKKVTIQFENESVFETVTILKSEKTTDFNSFSDPDKVREKMGEEPIKEGTSYIVNIPAASISVYKFQIVNN